MWIERRLAGLAGATALVGVWAFAVACGDEENPWPPTVLSGNPGGGVGGGAVGESDAATDDTGTGDAAEEGGDTQTIVNANLTTLCNDIAAEVGGYAKSVSVSCADNSTSTLKSPASLAECMAAFATYSSVCAATVQNALNCYTAAGACSNNTTPDCTALSTCGAIP
jgi:hypothetical protein